MTGRIDLGCSCKVRPHNLSLSRRLPFLVNYPESNFQGDCPCEQRLLSNFDRFCGSRYNCIALRIYLYRENQSHTKKRYYFLRQPKQSAIVSIWGYQVVLCPKKICKMRKPVNASVACHKLSRHCSGNNIKKPKIIHSQEGPIYPCISQTDPS